MKKIFISAINTDIGKTFVTLELIEKLTNLGFRVGAIKPIETGVKELPLDGDKILNSLREFNLELAHFKIDDIVPYQFNLPASVYVAKDCKIDFTKIEQAVNKFEPYCDILLIEGAGGLMVPIELDFFMVDLIEALRVDKTLLVTSSALGSISDTMLSLKLLRERGLDFEWGVNLYRDRDSFFKITYPFYRDYFKEIYILDRDLERLTQKLIK